MTHRDECVGPVEVLFTEGWQATRFSGPRSRLSPNLDSYHTDEPHELTVIVEVAGSSHAASRSRSASASLVVAGERMRRVRRGPVYQQMEIAYGRFERRIQLAEDIDPALTRARYEQGMVTVSLPVSEAPCPRATRSRWSANERLRLRLEPPEREVELPPRSPSCR